MAKLKFNPNGYQDLGAYALLKNIVENGHLIAEDTGGKMFPNGFKEVTASRDFQSSDVDYLLAVISPDVQLTMPEASPFTNGQTLAVLSFAANTSVVTVYSGAPLNLLGGENVNEVVQFKYQDGELFIINTGQVFDFTDTLRKTALRYLMDKDAALEETAGKIIDLGTITYEDVNAAPAESIVEVGSPMLVPDGYYIEKLYAHTTQNWEDLNYNKAYFVFNGLTIFSSIFLKNDNAKTYVVYSLGEASPCCTDAKNIDLNINFDMGNGEVNQQNYTTGSTSFKALIKKFPQ